MLALYFSNPPTYRSGLAWRLLYLDYPLKAVFTLPVWYLTFRTFRHWPLTSRVALNLALLPVWVKGWQWTYYWITDTFMDGGHLSGPAEWWDVYIPALFYVLQFGIFHSWRYYHDLRAAENRSAEAGRLALVSELTALKAQLNPHFLYNAFNTISASLGPGQEATRDMIAQLSDLFRYQLRANQEALLPLEAELSFVRDYLDLEKARFGQRLDYRIVLDAPELASVLIPPLLLQPLVENAVRHGLSPRMVGGTVVVRASTREGLLELTVADDGKGFDPAGVQYGFGITNTRRRLDLLYDTALRIDARPGGGGTRCSFSIPLTYAPQSNSDRRRSPRPQITPGVPG